jgi:hypothetical protein
MSRSRNSARSSAHTGPDGAKAFEIVEKMENKIHELDRLFSIATLLAEVGGERQVSDALAHIGGHGDSLVEEIKAMRAELFHLTWGYRRGQHLEKDEPDSGTDIPRSKAAA